MKKLIKYTLAVSAVALLAACGGGGGGDTSGTNTPGVTPVNADPQGLWVGQASTGFTVNTAVLENGETWGVYSQGSIIYGGLYGTTTTSLNNVNVNGTDFDFSTNRASQGNLTGLIIPKQSISLSGSVGGRTLSVPLTYRSNYEIAATSAAIAGTWSFVGRSGLYTLLPGSITINNAGDFTLIQTGCTTIGNVVPRPGGKNIYNLTLNASGVNCVSNQSSMTGIAYIDTSVTPNKFISLALTSNKNDGVIVIGTRR